MAWHEQRKGKHPSYLFKLKLTGNEKETTSTFVIKIVTKLPFVIILREL